MTYIDIDKAGGGGFEVVVAMHHRCAATWSWDHHAAEWEGREGSVLLWMVTGGEATLAVDDVTYVVRRGDCFVSPFGRHHFKGRHDPGFPLELTWLVFTQRGGGSEDEGVLDFPRHTPLTDLNFVEHLMQRLLAAGGVMQGVWLRVLLDEVRRQSAAQRLSLPQQQMQVLGEQIEADPGRYRSLAEMQAEFPYSKDHLIRLFRQEHGVAPYEFLIRTRIDRARALLLSSASSVKQIAAQLGYADAFCFSRQFKARTGVAPSVFRR